MIPCMAAAVFRGCRIDWSHPNFMPTHGTIPFPDAPTGLAGEMLAISTGCTELAGAPPEVRARRLAEMLANCLAPSTAVRVVLADGTEGGAGGTVEMDAPAARVARAGGAVVAVMVPEDGAAFTGREEALLTFTAGQAALLSLSAPAGNPGGEDGAARPQTDLEKELQAARTRQEMLLTAGEVGTWEYDVTRNIVTSDRNLAGMFGISEEQAVEGTALEEYLAAIHPEDLGPVQQSIQASLENGERFLAEYRLVGRDQSVRWVVARGIIIRDADGRPLRLPGVVVDITAQRRAEDELRATAARWKLALESAELGTWNIDPATRTLRTDDRLRMIFQGNTAPLGYDQAFELVHPDDIAAVNAAVAAATDPEHPVPYSQEYRLLRPDGTVVWVLTKGRATFTGTGPRRRLLSFDGVTGDITERRDTEAERKRAAEALGELAGQLSEADRRKDEFLATLAHELRNPLAPIRTGLEVMRMAAGNPEMMETVRTMMETQTQQMVRLIDDLMDLSRITSGKIDLRREKMDVRAAVRSAVDSTRQAVENGGHVLEVRLPEEPLLLEADAARVSQIVTNLLTNAVRYTEGRGRISLVVERDGGAAVIRVADTGIGIAPEMLERIFEMFTQASRVTRRSQGGLGVGLTLVRRMAELHGGTVVARSAGPGQGSEFIVRLPLPEPVEARHSPTPPATATGSPRIPRKVLVVDDNDAAAETLMMALGQKGHQVRVAFSGPQCLEIAEEFRPEVVLMDIGMPGMDGIEAAKRLRQEPWGDHVFIAALTGWGLESDRRKTSDAGFDRHLVKPVEPSVLDEMLQVAAR